MIHIPTPTCTVYLRVPSNLSTDLIHTFPGSKTLFFQLVLRIYTSENIRRTEYNYVLSIGIQAEAAVCTHYIALSALLPDSVGVMHHRVGRQASYVGSRKTSNVPNKIITFPLSHPYKGTKVKSGGTVPPCHAVQLSFSPELYQ